MRFNRSRAPWRLTGSPCADTCTVAQGSTPDIAPASPGRSVPLRLSAVETVGAQAPALPRRVRGTHRRAFLHRFRHRVLPLRLRVTHHPRRRTPVIGSPPRSGFQTNGFQRACVMWTDEDEPGETHHNMSPSRKAHGKQTRRGDRQRVRWRDRLTREAPEDGRGAARAERQILRQRAGETGDRNESVDW